jgi:hypothetical protein
MLGLYVVALKRGQNHDLLLKGVGQLSWQDAAQLGKGHAENSTPVFAHGSAILARNQTRQLAYVGVAFIQRSSRRKLGYQGNVDNKVTRLIQAVIHSIGPVPLVPPNWHGYIESQWHRKQQGARACHSHQQVAHHVVGRPRLALVMLAKTHSAAQSLGILDGRATSRDGKVAQISRIVSQQAR